MGEKHLSRTQKALVLSIVFHAFFLGLMTSFNSITPPDRSVEIEIRETPVTPLSTTPPKPQIIPAQSDARAKKSARPVTGVSKNSTPQNAATDAPVVKTGNTLSKAPDDLKMQPGEENLPAAAPEYEVNDWPRLQNDVRIPYPREAKQKGVEGTVVMDLYVADSGEVRKATLVQGPGHGLDEAALTAARQFRFSPARVQLKPVPVVIRYSYRFEIQK